MFEVWGGEIQSTQTYEKLFFLKCYYFAYSIQLFDMQNFHMF